MLITETIKRECCHPTKDLKRYLGILGDMAKVHTPVFCIHCGQIWVHVNQMDAAGGTEVILEKINISNCV